MVFVMKKALMFLLCISLIFGFAACSRAPAQNQTTSDFPQVQESVVAEQTQELVEIDLSCLGDICVAGVDSNEQYAVIYYTDYAEAGDGECDVTLAPIREYVAVFSLPENELVKTTEFPNGERYWYKVRVNKDGFDLVNQQIGEILTYGFSLNDLSKSTYDYVENWEKWEKIDTVDISWFNCEDQFSLSTSYGQAQALVFYDQTDTYYMMENNIYYEYRECFEHRILVLDSSANQTDRPESVVRVLDFDNKVEINSLKIPNNYSFNNIQCTNLNQKNVTVATYKDDGRADKAYVWNYNLNPKNTAFENKDCNQFAASELETKISDLCTRVRQKYGVVLECAPDLQFIRDNYNYSNDFSQILFYQKALDLEYDLSLLPKEVYGELLCDDTDDPAPFDEFRIYLVGTFPDDAIDAYAANIGCDETDGKFIVYIVYSCTGLNQRTFFHELMHTFEYRIWHYESQLDSQWEELNPAGFVYTDDYGACYYDESNADWQDYFTRDYGMKSTLEDRATCFEELCDGVLSDSMWWREKPQIAAKQQYLIKVLQKSFPALADWSIIEQAFPNG